jgi:hypothetical protein
MSFEEWMLKVDELMEQSYGVSIHDLPDQLYRDFYEDGMSPAEMVQLVVSEEGITDE